MTDRITQTETVKAEQQSLDAENQIPDAVINESSGLSRREVIKRTASVLIAAPLVGLPDAQAATRAAGAKGDSRTRVKAPLFFTKVEFALVDELSELIIPTDDHSPGARAAKVAAYIDARLAESFTQEPKQLWRTGLKQIEALSQEMYKRAFLQTTQEQRIALLTRISQNEADPKTPEETFFKELKTRTAQAYYSSKIGIHEEMKYKGNTYLKEFVGYDAT
jgi:hypothetical protein